MTLAVVPGARIGVVGPNGAGKSSLLRLMSGVQRPSAGRVRMASGVSVGLLAQEPVLLEDATVRGTVEAGVADVRQMLHRYHEIAARLASDPSDGRMAELGELQEQLDRRHAWDLDSRLAQAMQALRCPPPEASVVSLSGGERRRVALCRLLIARPDLLLLDEPTNHLDAETVVWLEQHLGKYPGTVVTVTHDRYFLDNLAQWICELDGGRAHLYEGGYSTYLRTKVERVDVNGARDARCRHALSEELDWVRAGAQGRRADTSARLRRFADLSDPVARSRPRDAEGIQIPPGPRLGALVVAADHVRKSVGGRVLVRDLSFLLPRGGIVGVIGPNGVGKTTLLRMLVGRDRPDSGSIRVGDTVRMSYVDQNRERLAPDLSAWEAVSGGRNVIRVGTVDLPSRAWLAAFGFKGADQQKPVRLFSGGERNRLNLALTLRQGGNLLLLDEPTNDLDLAVLASLERALLDFPGCAVITTHDRWVLDRIATHILAWEGTDADPGRWFWFEGNFESYEANKLARLGSQAGLHGGTQRQLTRG